MYRRALAIVAVVAAAAAGDAPAGPYDNPICGTAASPCKPYGIGNPGCNTATVNTGNGGVTTETYIVGRK